MLPVGEGWTKKALARGKEEEKAVLPSVARMEALAGGDSLVPSSRAFMIACYSLAALYCTMFVWSAWKLLVFSSISWTWTGQKTIHACIAASAGGACAANLSAIGCGLLSS